jgi:hypothetical protein
MELNNTLKENISSRGPAQALFEDCLVHDRSRPLLLILERSSDLFPVLQHNSSYQALIADLLDFKLNRVTVEVNDKATSTTKKKTYDLNVATDHFFQRFAGSPFPEAVEAYEKELTEVSQKESAIRSRPDFAKLSEEMVPGSSSSSGGIDGKSKDLSEAIENLPEILHRKALLEAHTNVMQNVMKRIASREIPTFFEFEQNLLTQGSRGMDKAAAIALLKDGSKGSIADKTRLLALIAVTILSSGASGSEANMDEYDAAFTQGCQAIGGSATAGDAASGGNSPSSSSSSAAGNAPSADEIAKALAGVSFLRRLLALQSSPMMRGFGGGGSGGGGLTSFLNTATNRATSLISKAASFFTKFTPFYATRIVHSLAEGRGGPEEDSFLYLDPRSRDPPSAASIAGTKYSDVIVFVIGGGSYAEYFNLQELLREKSSKGSASSGSLRSITYGCTDLLSGDEFIHQLEKLSAK